VWVQRSFSFGILSRRVDGGIKQFWTYHRGGYAVVDIHDCVLVPFSHPTVPLRILAQTCYLCFRRASAFALRNLAAPFAPSCLLAIVIHFFIYFLIDRKDRVQILRPPP
jgi:hypothetical protein